MTPEQFLHWLAGFLSSLTLPFDETDVTRIKTAMKRVNHDYSSRLVIIDEL